MNENDYHDYFVKDGQFIGAFEEMYRNCSDPWLQDAGNPLEEDIALALLRCGSYGRILDLGCGKGRFMNRLREVTGALVVGVDVSSTAAQFARARNAHMNVVAARVPPLPFASGAFDLVVTSQLLWCVIRDLSPLFGEIKRMLRPEGQYLIVQTFYQPGQQRYGNDVMQCPEDLIRRLPFRVMDLIEVNRFSNHQMIALLEPA